MAAKSTNKKVMIVDDDKDYLQELEETLAASGYDMISTDNSGIAIDMLKKTRPDVLLLDLKMPGKCGFELAEEIRQLPGFENIPIITMSAYYKNEYSLLMTMCRINRCLRKPFNPLDVISAIEDELTLVKSAK